jgi:hypothetical protein
VASERGDGIRLRVQPVQWQSGVQAQSQLWRLTPSGYLVNGYDPSLVLAVGSGGVVLATQSSTDDAQLCQLNAGEVADQARAGTLQCKAGMQLLTVTAYANGASLVMLDGTAPAQPDALWTMDPFPVPFTRLPRELGQHAPTAAAVLDGGVRRQRRAPW